MSHRVNSAQPVRPRVEAPVTEGLGPTYSPSPPIVNSNGQRIHRKSQFFLSLLEIKAEGLAALAPTGHFLHQWRVAP